MEVVIKGDDKKIRKFLKINKLLIKRNDLSVTYSTEDVEVESTDKVDDKPIRKRRTKAEIEADKKSE